MAPYLLYLLGHFVFNAPENHQQWWDWMADPVVFMANTLFFVALFIHAWVGMRDIIIDYIHVPGIRFALFGLTGLSLVAMGMWVLRTLFMVTL